MNQTSCDLCGSNEHFLILETKDYISGAIQRVVRCSNCGLAYVHPQPNLADLANYYPEMYYGEKPFLYERLDAFRRFRLVTKSNKNESTILDIGCGRGLVLAKLNKVGWETWGSELSECSSRYAKESLHLSIVNKDLQNCAFQTDYFDVIVMFHSLEHMRSPLTILKEAHRILKPSGTLIIEVPRFDSVCSRFFKDKWFYLDVPRHLFHFNDHTLEELLVAADFQVCQRKTYDLMYDAFGILQSTLNYICHEFNLLNDVNTKRKKFRDILMSKKKRLVIEFILSYSAQLVLFIPLLMLVSFFAPFNYGGTLCYHARKVTR